jgi:hypothetical protein
LGTLVLENNASIYQSDDEIVNTGNILREKTKPIFKFDYTYWSPVANQSLYNTSPETTSNKFFSFNPNTNSWLTEVSSKTMVTAKDILFEDPKISLQQPEQLMKLVSGDLITAKRRYFLDLHQVLI